MSARWSYAAASRCGTSHLEAKCRRQDAYRVSVLQDGEVFAAVACDGAGSSSHGGEGASIAARTLSSLMINWTAHNLSLPSPDMVDVWFAIARHRLLDHATARDISIHDMATTVVLALSSGSQTLTAHIGDGAIVARAAETTHWLTLSEPDTGENACETFFLTDAGDLRLRQSRHSREIDRLAIFTDGLERLALNFPAAAPHSPFFDGVSDPVATATTSNQPWPRGRIPWLSDKLGQYLSSDVVNARTDDDKTLITGVRV